MPIVAMPDGQQVNFPDDMPAEQIKGLIASKFPQLAQQAKQTGFSAITQPISNLIDAEKQRGANLANIVNATQQGQQTLPEGLAQGTMNEVGAASEVPSTIVSSIAKMGYDMLPGRAQKAIDTGEQKIAPLVQQYQQNQEAYAKENPRAARNFAAIRETANLLPFANPEVRAMAGTGTEAAGNAIKNIPGAIVDAVTSEPLPTSTVAKNISRASYAEADAKGGILTPDFANKFYDSLSEMKPQTEHGQATIGNDALVQLSKDWEPLKNKPISLQAAQEMDEGLSQKIDGFVDKTTGKLDKEGQKLFDVQTKLRNAIDNAKPDDVIGDSTDSFDALKRARNEWSTALRIGDMERIIKRASMTDNPATSIKTGFRTLANNPSRMRGYSSIERAAIENAAHSGIIGNTLRTVLGSRLIGGLAGAAAGSGAGVLGAGVGLLAGAAQSGASRAAATALQTSRANNAIRTVGKRIPREIWKMTPEDAQSILRSLKEK